MYYYLMVKQKKVKHESGLKSKFQQDCIHSGGCRGQSIFLPFLISRTCYYSLAHSLPPSVKLTILHHFELAYVISLSLLHLSFPYKDSCN